MAIYLMVISTIDMIVCWLLAIVFATFIKQDKTFICHATFFFIVFLANIYANWYFFFHLHH